MMTRVQYLLVKIAEEAAEVAQRATKAARFGLGEVQPGQPLDNAERLRGELLDLGAAILMLERVVGADLCTEPTVEAMRERVERIEKYLAYSVECGQVMVAP